VLLTVDGRREDTTEGRRELSPACAITGGEICRMRMECNFMVLLETTEGRCGRCAEVLVRLLRTVVDADSRTGRPAGKMAGGTDDVEGLAERASWAFSLPRPPGCR